MNISTINNINIDDYTIYIMVKYLVGILCSSNVRLLKESFLSVLNQTGFDDYEIMIIDRMVPGLDGLTLIKKIRDNGINTPVIFLTALNDIENRVQGFDAGGDDYLSKPFALEELVSRINALNKRNSFKKNQNLNGSLKSGDLEIDLTNRLCFRQKQKIDLNNKELMLLEYFIRFEGQKLTKSMLLELVWNINYDPTTSIVETHISRLRSKIEKPFKDRLIKTIRSSGYVYQSK